MSKLPAPDKIDRTKAFTDDQYEELKTLPSHVRRHYMRRDAAKMTQADIEKHYKSSNYPEFKYYQGGTGSLTPPHMRGVQK